MAFGGETRNQITLINTWTSTIPEHIISWDLGEMNIGRFEVFLDAAKILDILFVLMNSAPYTTEKHNPMLNCSTAHIMVVGLIMSKKVTR